MSDSRRPPPIEASPGTAPSAVDTVHGSDHASGAAADELAHTKLLLRHYQGLLAECERALEESRIAERIARLSAMHDVTTGLPNRRLFDDRMHQALSLAARQNWQLAVMFLDVDRFKAVNDRHGHGVGDAVLREISRRLTSHCREQDTVCRNGGDEFLYLLVNPQGRSNILRVADGIRDSVVQPIAASGGAVSVGISIGIALYPDDAARGDELIHHADYAMYRAKRTASGIGFC